MCVFLGFANRTQAGYTIQFSATDASLNHFDTAVNSTVNVGIYVAQNGASTDLTNFGLIAVGFGITYDSTKIQLDAANPFTFSSSFQNNPAVDASTPGTLLAISNSAFNQITGPVPFKGNPILLGTLSFQTRVAGNFNLAVGDFDPSQPGIADFGLGGLGASTNFDQVLFGTNAQGTYQFSAGQITAVPEPSSILLLSSLGMACVGLCRVRRMKNPA